MLSAHFLSYNSLNLGHVSSKTSLLEKIHNSGYCVMMSFLFRFHHIETVLWGLIGYKQKVYIKVFLILPSMSMKTT